MKIQQISKTALLVVVAISLVVFGVFFGFWGDEKYGDYDAPTFTGLLLGLIYALVSVTALMIVGSVVKSSISNKGTDFAAIKGVPSSKVTIGTWALFVVSLVIGYALGLGEPDFTAADGTVTTGSMVTIVDMFMTSIAILSVALVVAVIIAMSGILTKTASK